MSKRFRGRNELARQAVARASELNGVTDDVMQAVALGYVASGVYGRPSGSDAAASIDHLDDAVREVVRHFQGDAQ